MPTIDKVKVGNGKNQAVVLKMKIEKRLRKTSEDG